MTGPAEIDEVDRRAAACDAGQHYYRRDRTAPDDRQWTCLYCGAIAPQQPGVATPGRSLGWPA